MKPNSITKPERFRMILDSLLQLKPDLAIALVILACLAVTFAVSAYRRGPKSKAYRPGAEATAIQPLPPASPAPRPTEDLSVELVTIHPYGFEPDELVLSKGRFLLAIDNRSRLDQLSVQLLSPGAAEGTFVRSQVTRMPRGNVNWNRLVDLPPGEHVLTEENHPEWACKITIREK